MAMLVPLGPPLQTTVYPDLDAAKAALQAHARDNRYGVAIESSDKWRTFFRCSKGGRYDNRFKDSTVHPLRQRKNTSTMETGYKFQAVARSKPISGGLRSWTTTTAMMLSQLFRHYHNAELLP
jgi:hypothetical protein